MFWPGTSLEMVHRTTPRLAAMQVLRALETASESCEGRMDLLSSRVIGLLANRAWFCEFVPSDGPDI